MALISSDRQLQFIIMLKCKNVQNICIRSAGSIDHPHFSLYNEHIRLLERILDNRRQFS